MMDYQLSDGMQNFSLAQNKRDESNHMVGDFANSGELEKYMPKVMEMIQQNGGIGMNPFEKETSKAQKMNTMPDENQVPSNYNTSSNVSKNILMEPCTINQPLNSSLRKNFSLGTYYFLK